MTRQIASLIRHALGTSLLIPARQALAQIGEVKALEMDVALEGGFITGQSFTVDGGATRKMIYEE